MNGKRSPRRGLVLVIVLTVIVMIGGLLTLLAMYSSQDYRARQADQSRLVARAITESAAAYARVHLQEWSSHTPEKAIDLDVNSLLPASMNGAASIDFLMQDNHRTCRISGRAEYGPAGAVQEIIRPME